MSNVSCHGIEHLDSSVAECVTHVAGLICYPSRRTEPKDRPTRKWSRRARRSVQSWRCRARLICNVRQLLKRQAIGNAKKTNVGNPVAYTRVGAIAAG